MTNQFEVLYSEEAKNDLRALYAYIAFELKERQIATTLVNRIRKEIRALDFMPMRYPVVDWEPWASQYLRKMTVKKHVVFYLVDSESSVVTIVRILYGGQNIEAILGEEYI